MKIGYVEREYCAFSLVFAIFLSFKYTLYLCKSSARVKYNYGFLVLISKESSNLKTFVALRYLNPFP